MNFIYLAKGKLMYIDFTLPILMEIKAQRPDIKVIIYLVNRKQYDIVKQNHTLWSAMEEVGIIRPDNKILKALGLVKFLCRFAGRTNIIIDHGEALPLHRITMRILKKISHTREIECQVNPVPLCARESQQIEREFVRGRK